MREAALIFDREGRTIATHTPANRSAGALPNSAVLWTLLWDHREDLGGIAHSHPGRGAPEPSWTDRTTFAAIEAGLATRLHWWIATEDQIACFVWAGGVRYAYRRTEVLCPIDVALLRRLSEYELEELCLT